MDYEKALRDWLNHKQNEVKSFTRIIINDIEDYADEWVYSLDPRSVERRVLPALGENS